MRKITLLFFAFILIALLSACSESPAQSSATNTNTPSHFKPFENDPSDDQESNLKCEGKIKGNANSYIYHVPGDAYYDRTWDNIVWFCSEADAQKAGYRKSER